MLPNRTVVAVLMALLASGYAVGPADAQAAEADVIVTEVDYGIPRVAEISAPVNITIRNVGTATFNPPTGWQIFVGLNGRTSEACITASDNAGVPTDLQPCYIRMAPGSQNPTSIPAGESRTYQVPWRADPREANTSAFIWVEILGLTDTPGTPEACTGPDGTSTCANNYLNKTGVRIDRLGVRASPERLAPPGTGLDANDPWRFDDVPTSQVCPPGTGDAPRIVDRGCWATPGSTLLASFYVNNTGTIEDTYIPEIVPADLARTFAAGGYQFSFAPPIVQINANASKQVRMSILLPENETAREGLNINQTQLSVTWRSARLPALTTGTGSPTNVGCSETPCDDPTLPTILALPRYQFNLTANFSFDDAFPGETSEFRINLTNLGNDDDRYNVSFVRESWTINDSWAPSIEASSYLGTASGPALAPNGNHSVRLFVTPPARTTNGTYWFDVAVKSRGDTQSTARCRYWEGLGPSPDQVRVTGTGPTCTVRFYVNVRQVWNISGASDLPRREVPGKTVTYTLSVGNDGNGYDDLTLNLASSVSGWDARLSTPTLNLTPGNRSSFQLTVTAPPNLPENTQAAFYVNATSSGPPDRGLDQRSNVSLMSLFTIARGPNIRLDAPTTRAFVEPGRTVNFTVTATNIGNVADNFTIPLPTRPSDWAVNVDPAFKEVQPGESFPITVSLRPPNTALTGENATATVRVASTVDRALDATLRLEANISGPDLFADDIVTNSTTPYTGDPLEVTVLFANLGDKAVNRNMTIRLYFVQGGVERLIGERTYDPSDPNQAIGAQRRVSERFVWDTSNLEGSGTLLARLDVDNTVREMDESVSSNEATKTITFRRFALRLDPAQPQTARPGETAEVTFAISYMGDDRSGEPVRILVASEHGWVTSNADATASVLPGTPLPIEVTLAIPRLPGTSRDVVSVTVIPTLRPAEAQRATVTISIIDEEKPIVKSIVATPSTALIGQNVILSADVEDATGVTTVTAYVTSPTNQTSAHPMTQVGGLWVLNSTYLVPGAYRVTADASDAADPPNRNTTRGTVGVFTMLPGPGPDIRLAAGQGTTIRTGTLIKIAITDATGIARASYAIRGVSYDLRAPDFVIDTSTFPNGTVAVNVTAENLHGVRTTQTFTFTVDNDAPAIARVTMDPARPRAGDTVKVTISTANDVQGVTVALRLDGNLVHTLNATRRTAGTFETTFDAAEGDYRLDVTASDTAGNARVEDGAVQFSARPGSPIPNPAWVGLLGLVGVALLLRRRG